MFVIEKFSDEEDKVIFYTVRASEENEFSETEDFFNRMRISNYKEEFYELVEFTFTSIGQKLGAQECFFNRLEQDATAMPPQKHGKAIKQAIINEINFQIFNNRIRLYCLRLSDSVVVLFNGGIKLTDGPAQKDSGVSMYFHEANVYCKKITEAIKDGDISIEHRNLTDTKGNNNKIFIL